MSQPMPSSRGNMPGSSVNGNGRGDADEVERKRKELSDRAPKKILQRDLFGGPPRLIDAPLDHYLFAGTFSLYKLLVYTGAYEYYRNYRNRVEFLMGMMSPGLPLQRSFSKHFLYDKNILREILKFVPLPELKRLSDEIREKGQYHATHIRRLFDYMDAGLIIWAPSSVSSGAREPEIREAFPALRDFVGDIHAIREAVNIIFRHFGLAPLEPPPRDPPS
jgi:hypothetical protein